MINDNVTTDFSKLPNWIQVQIKELGITNTEIWIKEKIPAIGNRSVLEILCLPEGEKILRDYFMRIKGR